MNKPTINAPLFFVRHGETDWNLAKKFQGQTDIPLNDHGKKQACENAVLLVQCLNNLQIDPKHLAFISSSLSRARKTMELIVQHLDIPESRITTEHALKEISFGLFEGLTSSEAKRQYYQARQNRRKDRWSIAPPDGESFASRVDGVSKCLQGVRKNSVIVTHSGILRIIAHILQDLPAPKAVDLDIPHLGVTIWDGNKLFSSRNLV